MKAPRSSNRKQRSKSPSQAMPKSAPCSLIASMVAALGALDALIFTAGIGENSPAVREAACANFGFLQMELDPAANNRSRADQDIASRDSAVRVLVIRAQEDWAIAGECWKMYSDSPRAR